MRYIQNVYSTGHGCRSLSGILEETDINILVRICVVNCRNLKNLNVCECHKVREHGC